MAELTIRKVLADDTAEVLRIYVASWNLGFGERMPRIEADPDRLARWQVDLAAPSPQRWWLAERDGAIVGFAGIGPCRDPVDPALGELDTIAVDPNCWRSGVGRALMSQALRALSSDGYREAVLWTFADYPRGDTFYRAMGWSRSGTFRNDGTQLLYRHPLRSGPSAGGSFSARAGRSPPRPRGRPSRR